MHYMNSVRDEKEKYTYLQYKEIQTGREHGLSEQEIRLYARPRFNYLQMQFLRQALEDGLDSRELKKIAKTGLSVDEMKDYQVWIQYGRELPVIFPAHVLKIMCIVLFFVICGFCAYRWLNRETEDPLVLTDTEITLYAGDVFLPGKYVLSSEGELVLPESFTAVQTGTRLVVYKVIGKNRETEKQLRITILPDHPPRITLTDTSITVEDGEITDCYRYVLSARDEEDGDLRSRVTCTVITNDTERYIRYEVKDHHGNTADALLPVEIVVPEQETPEPEAAAVRPVNTPPPVVTPPPPEPVPAPLEIPVQEEEISGDFKLISG